MKENESQIRNADSEKARIRARYKGIDPSELDFIPAAPQENFYEDKREKRVAVYARVSTDDPRQTSSYELQKNHYTDVVSNHPGWKLVDIYAEIIVPYMIQLRFGDFVKECKNLLIYMLSDTDGCADVLFFACGLRSTVSKTVRGVCDYWILHTPITIKPSRNDLYGSSLYGCALIFESIMQKAERLCVSWLFNFYRAS